MSPIKRKKPLARSSTPLRKTPIKRGGRIKAKKRSSAEFQRIYGSKARVAWVKSLRCVWCLRKDVPSENAHTENGGMGRKADFSTIAPLCRVCHQQYDQHQSPFDLPGIRALIRNYAHQTHVAWEKISGSASTPPGSGRGASQEEKNR